MSSSRQRWSPRASFFFVLMALVGAGLPLAAPAAANHNNCVLDLTQVNATNPLGTQHTVTATIRPAGTDPNGSSTAECTTRDGGRIDVSFEITGQTGATYSPTTIDAASTPATPDLSCSMSPNSTSCVISYTRTAVAGTDQIVGFYEAHGVGGPSDTLTKTWVAPSANRLDCAPETDTNPTGTAHVITCTATNSSGQVVTGIQVDAEASGPSDPDFSDSPSTPDFTCTTGGAGTCTFSHTGDNIGTTSYRAWIDADGSNSTVEADASEGQVEASTPGATAEPDNTDVVAKTWTATATTATRLDCNPETDSNPTGTAHVITCTATNNSNQTISGAQIDIEITGANDPDAGSTIGTRDLTCTTGGNGTCTVTHGPGGTGTTTVPGTTTYVAWIDFDQNNATGGPDTGEGQTEGTAPGNTAEPDHTDVVTKAWVSAPASVRIAPTSDSASVGTCNAFTITVLDTANQPVSGVTLDVEQVHALATNNVSNDEPTVTFCTPTTGANPSAVDESRGDLRESPDNRGTAGGEATTATNSAGQVTIGISVAPGGTSDGTGNVTVTAFTETTDNDDPDTADPKATATKTWVVPEARTIDCEPESAASPLRTQHTITCTVRDRFGEPLPGVSVTFTETGEGSISGATTVVTGAAGTAATTVTSTTQGAQAVTGTLTDDLTGNEPSDVDPCDRAANDPAGSPAGVCADSVSVTWTAPPPGTTCPGFEADPRNQVVGTDGHDVLEGTAGADIICGFGGDDTISGGDGNDLLIGGDGKDAIQAGLGDDTVFGEGDKDVILGDAGNDELDGGAGNDNVGGGGDADVLLGRGGWDTLKGNAGDDLLVGAEGNDILQGGGGDDTARGGADDDVLKGYIGNDTLRGGGGDDLIRGSAGRDRLLGNAGNDFLDGGSGRDRCRGGRGSDILRSCP